MSARRNLLVVACMALSACSTGSSSSPTASSSAPSPTVATTLSSAVIVLHETPDNLGCDAIGIEYKTMTFRIDPAAAEPVSAMTDTGISLVTYWPSGFTAGSASEGTVRDDAGVAVATDGETLEASEKLHGYDVCLAPTKLYVMRAAPSEPPAATTQPSARATLQPTSWTITLVANLRVRSEPRISDDSIKYEPLLPKGTTFEIVRGPVIASGYSWYLVKLEPGSLRDGIAQGWLAEGDRDGTQWIKNIPID